MALQNEQLNKCVDSAMAMMQKQEIKNKGVVFRLEGMDVAESRRRLLNMNLEELKQLTRDIEAHETELKEISVSKKDAKHSNTKIDALDTAHTLIKDSKEIVAVLNKMFPCADADASTASNA